MTLMLKLWEWLCQWICDIIIGIYFANFNISTLNNFSNEMEMPENMFGSLMRSRFLSLCNGSCIITI
ncbi:hypothetical protein A1395_31535 [Pseudomonas protegens]|nr:hypothetical protein A1395_31535 [Pseudomonas protegens]